MYQEALIWIQLILLRLLIRELLRTLPPNDLRNLYISLYSIWIFLYNYILYAKQKILIMKENRWKNRCLWSNKIGKYQTQINWTDLDQIIIFVFFYKDLQLLIHYYLLFLGTISESFKVLIFLFRIAMLS